MPVGTKCSWAPIRACRTNSQNSRALCPLFAFTNTNPTHEAAWRARYADALDHFEEIYVSSTIGLRKPDQQAFEYVADAMQLAPEQILFLDDNPENIRGAEASGLNTVQTRGEAEVLAALADYADRLGR